MIIWRRWREWTVKLPLHGTKKTLHIPSSNYLTRENGLYEVWWSSFLSLFSEQEQGSPNHIQAISCRPSTYANKNKLFNSFLFSQCIVARPAWTFDTQSSQSSFRGQQQAHCTQSLENSMRPVMNRGRGSGCWLCPEASIFLAAKSFCIENRSWIGRLLPL